MIRELFEKAKFGDRFVTRGGQEALFLRLTENSEWKFADFYVKDWGQIRVNRENGKCLNGPDIETDIVRAMPSLPSDLDSAANNYGVDVRLGYPRVMDETDRYIYNAFKAGAKWMAEQGETLESLIWRDEDDKLFIDALVDENKFKMADNVTIQVRKKQ